MNCKRCNTKLVNGRELTSIEKKCIDSLTYLSNYYVLVCPMCYPDKITNEV